LLTINRFLIFHY